MTDFQLDTMEISYNPLDLIEEVALSNEWAFERVGKDQLTFEVPGRWSVYVVTFYWNDDSAALLLTTDLDLHVKSRRSIKAVWEALALVNERIGFGCFLSHSKHSNLAYRQSSLWRGVAEVGVERIEDMIETALTECERFYPIFHAVIHHHRKPGDAIAAGTLETVGEA